MFPSNGQLKRRPPSLRGVLRSSSPASTLLWNASTPCRSSRRTSFPSLGDSIVPSPVRPHQLGRAVDQPGVGKPGLQAGSHDGDGGPQVPERPSCLRLFFDPGRPSRQPSRRLGTAPACVDDGRSREQKVSGLDRLALGLAVYASQREVARHHAGLGFRLLAKLVPAGFVNPQGCVEGFEFESSSSPSRAYLDAMTPDESP